VERNNRYRFLGALLLLGLIVSVSLAMAQEPAGNEASADEVRTGIWRFLNRDHLTVLVAIVGFGALFGFFLWVSRRGKTLYLRRLPGIAAIEEAVGRATEMGRPVLYVPGIDRIDEIQTLAGIAVLGHVARMVAEYDARIVVPTRDSVVMSVCEETVRQSYLAAGRPDAYQPDIVRYLSDEQFAYTAGVDGIMLRERPAANIYMGGFYAESLILAETGFASGAIQVAGTANIPQLPFFITACDYTLIAEEFYAASAYLSKEPKILASIKASDYFKILVILAILLGILWVNAPEEWTEAVRGWF
jgi:hypothetical protein